MATEWKYSCKCKVKDKLLNALDRCVGGPPRCPSCGKRTELILTHEFQMGIGKTTGNVLQVFKLDKPLIFKHLNERITFLPRLVVLELIQSKGSAFRKHKGQQFIWFPYWHEAVEINTNKQRTPYGQWAPFIIATDYRELISKAEIAGFLKR